MFAARITLPHLSVSAAMSIPKSAGEPENTSAPSSANRALSLKSRRPALISLLRLSIVAEAVFLGATTPYHVLASKPGTCFGEPAADRVGFNVDGDDRRSGRLARRLDRRQPNRDQHPGPDVDSLARYWTGAAASVSEEKC